MIRTQVYISETEKKMLSQLSRQTQKTQSELIREAIGLLCHAVKKKSKSRADRMRAAAGIWADRTDLDEFFTKVRKEADRKW